LDSELGDTLDPVTRNLGLLSQDSAGKKSEANVEEKEDDDDTFSPLGKMNK